MSREAVLDSLFQKWTSCGKVEYIPLKESYGRVLAADVKSVVTLPVERVSAFDGIAVRSEDFIQHGVSAVPGRPMAFAVMEGKVVINLPGPSMAAYFGMDWCIRRLIEHWYHQSPQSPIRISGILMEELPKGGPIEILHKIKIVLSDSGEYLLYPLDFRKENAAECMMAKGQYVTKIFEKEHSKGSVLKVDVKNYA